MKEKLQINDQSQKKKNQITTLEEILSIPTPNL
jgi:hypothetical protein